MLFSIYVLPVRPLAWEFPWKEVHLILWIQPSKMERPLRVSRLRVRLNVKVRNYVNASKEKARLSNDPFMAGIGECAFILSADIIHLKCLPWVVSTQLTQPKETFTIRQEKKSQSPTRFKTQQGNLDHYKEPRTGSWIWCEKVKEVRKMWPVTTL